METEQKADSNNSTLMRIIIIVLLLGLGISLYFNYIGNEKNVDLTAEKTQLETDFQKLSDTLDIRNSEILVITDKNTELDSVVTASQLKIEEDRKKISSLLAKTNLTKKEIKEAKQMIAEYEVSIAELKANIVAICAQNEQLTIANKKLGEDLAIERQAMVELNEQNKGLSKTVEVGSLLKLTLLEVEGVKKRPNGRDRAVVNASAAENIKITFETGENNMLSKGNVSLYVRIINPKGETISVESQGSGVLTLAESDSKIQYSTKVVMDWNQTNIKVSVYWGQYISTEGTYKVEIYQSGYIIGKGEVTLN